MATRTENHLIARLDRNHESDPRLKFARLFRVRPFNPVSYRIYQSFADSKIAAKTAKH